MSMQSQVTKFKRLRTELAEIDDFRFPLTGWTILDRLSEGCTADEPRRPDFTLQIRVSAGRPGSTAVQDSMEGTSRNSLLTTSLELFGVSKFELGIFFLVRREIYFFAA